MTANKVAVCLDLKGTNEETKKEDEYVPADFIMKHYANLKQAEFKEREDHREFDASIKKYKQRRKIGSRFAPKVRRSLDMSAVQEESGRTSQADLEPVNDDEELEE